jgi:uncharacterized protein (TIGR02996 family)
VTDEAIALWLGILERPEDAARLLVYADWLAERGRDPELEAGLRWCAANRKWPREVYRTFHLRGRCWGWGNEYAVPAVDEESLPSFILPWPIWNMIDRLCSRPIMTYKGLQAKRPATLIRRLGLALAVLAAEPARA